jgi:transposase
MTAQWHTRQELIHQVVTLTTQGMSRRAITRALGVSRNTTRKILREQAQQRDSGHSALPKRPERVPRAAKIVAHRARVQELARYPDITAQRVLEILSDEGFTGGYTGVKKHLRRVRPAPKPTPSLEASVFGPGEMAESDWSPYELTYTDRRKELVQLSLALVERRSRRYSDVMGCPEREVISNSIPMGHPVPIASRTSAEPPPLAGQAAGSFAGW